MSYDLYATEYETLEGVEDVTVRPLDARGEPGNSIPGVKAIFAEPIQSELGGTAFLAADTFTTITVFADTLPREAVISPQVKLRRDATGGWFTVISSPLRVYGTRYVCRCIAEVPVA